MALIFLTAQCFAVFMALLYTSCIGT
jgi:hypothetical protein